MATIARACKLAATDLDLFCWMMLDLYMVVQPLGHGQFGKISRALGSVEGHEIY